MDPVGKVGIGIVADLDVYPRRHEPGVARLVAIGIALVCAGMVARHEATHTREVDHPVAGGVGNRAELYTLLIIREMARPRTHLMGAVVLDRSVDRPRIGLGVRVDVGHLERAHDEFPREGAVRDGDHVPAVHIEVAPEAVARFCLTRRGLDDGHGVVPHRVDQVVGFEDLEVERRSDRPIGGPHLLVDHIHTKARVGDPPAVMRGIPVAIEDLNRAAYACPEVDGVLLPILDAGSAEVDGEVAGRVGLDAAVGVGQAVIGVAVHPCVWRSESAYRVVGFVDAGHVEGYDIEHSHDVDTIVDRDGMPGQDLEAAGARVPADLPRFRSPRLDGRRGRVEVGDAVVHRDRDGTARYPPIAVRPDLVGCLNGELRVRDVREGPGRVAVVVAFPYVDVAPES